VAQEAEQAFLRDNIPNLDKLDHKGINNTRRKAREREIIKW
jgi:hypothetical protein